MNIERTQYIGHYGVTFTVLRLIALPAIRHALCLLEAGTSANELRQRLVDFLFEKMLARDVPCKITIAISTLITRQHADLLNIRGEIIKGLIRSYHGGDVVIGVHPQVKGGISPQRSLSSMIRQFHGG